MNITSAQYQTDTFTNEPSCFRTKMTAYEMFVPLATDNRHYAEIMRQVEAGELVVQEADQ